MIWSAALDKLDELAELNDQKRLFTDALEYLVFWEGYPPEEATWEPGESLVGTAAEALQEFHRRYPKQPRDSHVRA